MKKILISIAVLCAALLLSTVAVAAETEFTINGVTVTASSGTAVNNCSLYASQVLQKIWQYKGVTTTFYSNYNMLKTKTDEERKITEEHTREYIQNAPLGSRIRITHYSSNTNF